MEDHHLVLEDLGSTNGTFVNRKKITKARVGHGSEIEFGRLYFLLRDADYAFPTLDRGAPSKVWGLAAAAALLALAAAIGIPFFLQERDGPRKEEGGPNLLAANPSFETLPGPGGSVEGWKLAGEKFSLALGRQRLEQQPDEVFADLKYHLAWNVIHRSSAFVDDAEYAAFFQEVFREYGESSGSWVVLLWLCTDHIHVYAECPVDRSVEDLVSGIKQLSEDALLARFPNLKDRFFPEGEVWDPAYFVGTVG